LKRIFFTPFDWQLLRDSAVPVHLVIASPHALPRKILVSIDVLHDDRQVKELNDHIIEAATTLASSCKAKVHLLSIYDWSSLYVSDTGIGSVPVSVSPSYDERKKIFDAVATKHSIPKDHRYFVTGSPIKAISDFAAKNEFDVLVMGTYSHRALNKLLGSTAEHILYRPPCSILAVSPR
jgi:universal stress protein E